MPFLPLLLGLGAIAATECLPTLTEARIVLEPSTVWIQSPTGNVVTFNRSTREWRRVDFMPARDTGAVRRSPASRLLCFEHGETLTVAPGVRLVALDSLTNGAWWSIHHDGAAKPVRLKIADRFKPKPVKPRPKKSEYDNEPEDTGPTEFSPYPSAMLRDGDLLWFGLYGSDTDNGTYLGGLLRYSMRTRALASFVDSSLSWAAVTSMATAGGTLWMGTASRKHDEYRGPDLPGVGLVQLTRDGRFRQFTSDSSPLPDNTPGALAAAGDTLWMATDRGVAMLDTRAMRWTVRYFKNVFTLDSVYVALVEGDPDSTTTVGEKAREMIFALMGELRVKDSASFLAAASQLDSCRLASMLEFYKSREYGYGADAPLRGVYYDAIEVLRTPGMVPQMSKVLREGGSSWVPSLVFRELGDTVWRAEMRAGMQAAPRRAAIAIAGILADSGDTSAIAWVRSTARQPDVWKDTLVEREEELSSATALLDIMANHPDLANLPVLLKLLETRPDEMTLRAIWAMNDVSALAEAARRIVGKPMAASTWLSLARNGGFDTLTLASPTMRAAAKPLIHATLRAIANRPGGKYDPSSPTGSDPAAAAAADIEDASAVPLLIGVLPFEWTHSEPANKALIRLTGVHPPGKVRGSDELTQFWNAWWKVNGATFRPVSRAAGLQALARYEKAVQESYR